MSPKLFAGDAQWKMATDSRHLRFHGANVCDCLASQLTERPNFAPTTLPEISPTRHTQATSQQIWSSLRANSQRSFSTDSTSGGDLPQIPKQGYGSSIQLTEQEKKLFRLLNGVCSDTNLSTTLRIAGGWVRDKLLATPDFQAYHKVFAIGGKRLTSKFQKPAPSLGRQGTKVLIGNTGESVAPVDIDVALDNMLGREFADHLNTYLQKLGEESVSVGVVLKNPEKSKHLETATMKVESFWIDFVNLRAEEYTKDSRIPDLMRIGTAAEDAYRRDLTINALFYNVNSGQIEDWTGRGFDDLQKGVIATPLAPLTTLLDDPLRVLRSVRFAARLRFSMDTDLASAATDERVRTALAQKVSRERVGGEVDLMLRSPDPVGAMKFLVKLMLLETVFPIEKYNIATENLLEGVDLLTTCHDHLADCRLSPPLWCVDSNLVYEGGNTPRLVDDDESRRLLWYASLLKPIHDDVTNSDDAKKRNTLSKRSNRSIVLRLLVDDLKRPGRDAEAVEKIIRAASYVASTVASGYDVSSTMIVLSEIRVSSGERQGDFVCTMGGREVDPAAEEDPIWVHSMEFRVQCARILKKVGPLWRASLVLAISEQLACVGEDAAAEERRSILERFDVFAAAMQQMGLIGIWNEKPLLDGDVVKSILPRIPRGPVFRTVMDTQEDWMISHPGAPAEHLKMHLVKTFPEFAQDAS